MRVALIGTRGIPATYGGFETCAEHLAIRLARRGHQVTVYNRIHHVRYLESTYEGVRLIRVPGLATKHLDTITHTFSSMLHALSQSYEALLVFNAGNAPLCAIPRWFSKARVVLNVDGLDWKRQKWGPLARSYIQWAERVSHRFAHVVVTDSRTVQEYYRNVYGLETRFIPYGAHVLAKPPGEVLRRFGLQPRRYVLFVGRLVPENCAHHLVDAWLMLQQQGLIPLGYRCVITGDAPYASDYIAGLRARARGCSDIVFTGYQFGDAYAELGGNAQIFVETSEVGGMHPALIEAMAFGNCVVVNNTPVNLETIQDAGFAYEGKEGAFSLARVLSRLLCSPDIVESYRIRAKKFAQLNYSWDAVTDQYERLLLQD